MSYLLSQTIRFYRGNSKKPLSPVFPIIWARAIVFIFILIWGIMNPEKFYLCCSFKGIKGLEIVLVALSRAKQ